MDQNMFLPFTVHKSTYIDYILPIYYKKNLYVMQNKYIWIKLMCSIIYTYD